MRPELRPLAHASLAATPGVFFIATAPHDVFRQEGDGLAPGLFEWPLTEAMLSPRGLQLGRFEVPWGWVAYAARGAAWWWTGAERLGKRARRSGATHPGRRTLLREIVAGQFESLPRWLRPFARAQHALFDRVGPRLGVDRRQMIRAMELRSRGLAWASASPAVPRRQSKGWKPEDVRAKPAMSLRAAIELMYENDLSRIAEPSDVFDVLHVAYVAYSDVATIDGENWNATKSVRCHLPDRSIIPSGKLDQVLDAIDERRARS